MPYTTTTLDQFAAQVGVLMDDTAEVYWSRQEKYFAIWDALYVWGAYTNYWRARGTFNLIPSTAYYDLAVELPALRTRTWTLDQLTKEIQFMCLEAANGVTGTGMSGQIGINSILQAIQRARNQFVLDARLPYAYNSILASVPSNGLVSFPQTSVYVHRASWQDLSSGVWTNLWREDAWQIDHANPAWPTTPDTPRVYSESENAPLVLQVAPPPVNAGTLDAITVDSLVMNLANPAQTFSVPDEWIHAIKFAALADLLSSESQCVDPVRSQYANMRYMQAMELCKNARSVLRLLYNSIPLPVDSFAALDAASPYWRNQPGAPEIAGVLYDFLAFLPGSPDQTYGIAADVVQAAPIPLTGADYMPIGEEDIPHLLDYIGHMLTFKCGGKEFENTFPQYDAFMEAVAARGRINRAKIRNLTALFATPQKEQGERPDRMEATQNA